MKATTRQPASGGTAASEYEEITLRVPAEVARSYRQIAEAQRDQVTERAVAALSEDVRIKSESKDRSERALRRLLEAQGLVEAACSERQIEEMRAYTETLS